MNALITMEAILEPVPGAVLSADSIFGTGQAETILAAIEAQVRAEVYDIATPDGRERIKSVAYKIARSKTTLDDIGKEHVADIKAQSASIDKERKTIRDRLDALKEEVRGPLALWEAAEAGRVQGHEAAIVEIIESARFAATVPSSNAIEQRISAVRDICNRDWQEFHERADAAATDTLASLETMLATARQAEADAAELAELRRLKAEREEADRLAAAAAEAAEKARREAKEKAAREAEAAERLSQQQEQAQRDKEAAVAAAIEAERVRAEREKAAAIEAERRRQELENAAAATKKAAEEAAERKRQENKRHRERVHARISGALIEFLGDADAKLVIDAIAAGRVPHVSITY